MYSDYKETCEELNYRSDEKYYLIKVRITVLGFDMMETPEINIISIIGVIRGHMVSFMFMYLQERYMNSIEIQSPMNGSQSIIAVVFIIIYKYPYKKK